MDKRPVGRPRKTENVRPLTKEDDKKEKKPQDRQNKKESKLIKSKIRKSKTK